jgi:LacI family transcriptional regulator
MMTIFDIADKLKVSPSTVSRALNPATAHLISEPVREKIQGYAQRSGFVPNRTAQELVRGRSHTIGVVASTAFNSMFFSDQLTKVLGGLYSVLEADLRYSCKLLMLPRGMKLSESDNHVLRTGVDGLLISTICDYTSDALFDLAERLQERTKRPVVALNLPPRRGSHLSVVSFSNREAAYLAVTDLIRKGHERIAIVFADNGSADVKERLEGYKRALADHKIPYRKQWAVQGDFTAKSGYESSLPLLRQERGRPTAVFCVTDEMAIGVLRTLKALRLLCPKDVAVMGFDGLEAGELTEPRLSSVRQPFFEIAQAGTQLLLDLIEGKKKSPVSLSIAAPLIIRDSA